MFNIAINTFFLWLFIAAASFELASAADDPMDEIKMLLVETNKDNFCSWRRACTTQGSTHAELTCQAALTNFNLLSTNQRRLCGNAREPSCQWLRWRRVCSFRCDPTNWEFDEALRLRWRRLPQTRLKSLSEVLKPLIEQDGARLETILKHRKRQMQRERLRNQLHPQQPQELHPLLPGMP